MVRPFPGARIRIIDFPTRAETGWRYDSDIRMTAECTTKMTEIDAAYRNVLAQIPAEQVQEIESFD
jgi:hypothetical protein